MEEQAMRSRVAAHDGQGVIHDDSVTIGIETVLGAESSELLLVPGTESHRILGEL
jgi:hypothetical protein